MFSTSNQQFRSQAFVSFGQYTDLPLTYNIKNNVNILSQW